MRSVDCGEFGDGNAELLWGKGKYLGNVEREP